MPKFYHSKRWEIVAYSARAVGFWRRFLFVWVPYFTGSGIASIEKRKIHLTLKHKGVWWKSGLFTIDPPWLIDWYDSEYKVALNQHAFFVDPKELGEKWSICFYLLIPHRYDCQPLNLRCEVQLTDLEGTEHNSFVMADLPIRDRTDWAIDNGKWVFTTIIAVVALIVAIIGSCV